MTFMGGILSQGLCSKNGLGNVETGLTLNFSAIFGTENEVLDSDIFFGSLFSVEAICYFLKKWF